MHRPIFCGLVLTILLLSSRQVAAQDLQENNFVHYTTQQGLTHNMITGIAQDSIGYLWVATASGLNRYNGNQFVQFHSSNDSNSLPAQVIDGIMWLDSRRLALRGNGLHILDTYTGKARNLFVPWHNKQNQYKFNFMVSLASSKAGDLFIVARSGFYHFDKNYQLQFRYDRYSDEEIATSDFAFGREIFWLDDERLMIVATNGIHLYNIPQRRLSKMLPNDWPAFAEFLDYPGTRYKFYQPSAGSFAILNPGSDSLIYLDAKTGNKTTTKLPFNPGNLNYYFRSKLIPVSDSVFYLTGPESGFYKMVLQPRTGRIVFFPKKYFSSYHCRSILLDKDQTLWIATNKGLFRQDKAREYLQQVSVPAQVEASTPNIVIDELCVNGDKLFVGTRGGGGVLVYDKKDLRFIRQAKIEDSFGMGSSNIYALAATNKDHLLVGTNGPLYKMDLKTYSFSKMVPRTWNPNEDWISDLYKDRSGNVWITSGSIYKLAAGTDSFEIFTSTQKLFNRIHMAMHICEDKSRNIWFAGHGLCRYNTSSQKFDWLIDSFPYIKMPDKQVNTLVADENYIWIALYNNGLVRYSLRDKTFRQFTRDDGLPDNSIAALYMVGNKLWVAGYSGMACVDLNTFHIVSFGKEDGFPDMPIVQGANFFYDSSQHYLYIGFSNAVVRFNPDSMLAKIPTPQMFVESITAGDQQSNYLPAGRFSSSWQDNEITVNIGSINFFNNSSQRFAYRIVKNDADRWQPLGTRNTFAISNLSPGTHRIQVKLYSSDNRWPEQVKEILVDIRPPFWREAWFTTILAAVLLFGFYALVKWQTGLVRKQEQQKTHIQELKAQDYKNKFELEQISNYFSSSMADKKRVEDVLWDLTRNLIARLNYEDCMIYLWNEDKTKMIQKAAYGPKGSPEALRSDVFDVVPGQGVVGYVMQTKEPLLIPDTRNDPRYRKDEMIRMSEICVPIIHNGELIGIIDSEHSELNYYKETDMKILTTIATLVGNKIRQIESEQSLRVQQEEIASINQQLAEAQLSALQTQMNPHFIFNALNSIKRMILDNQQQKASRYLSKFAEMIRLTLNQSKEIFATLEENIDYLERYLEMEKLRFDDSFTFQIVIGPGVDEEEAMIPTLMIQPLVENAIWHGLMHNEGEKKLSIRFTRQVDTLVCTIEDNGIGIRQSKKMKQEKRSSHRSMGLENLHNRIMIMNEKFETGCRLEITDMKDLDASKNGTLAVLRFNIVNNKLSYESIAG